MPISKGRPAAPTKPKHLKSSSSVPTQKGLAIRTPTTPRARARNNARVGDENDEAQPEEQAAEEQPQENAENADNTEEAPAENQSVAAGPGPESVIMGPPDQGPEKKKKKKIHPQDAVKQLWKNYDPEYHGKVTRILPEPVPTDTADKTKPQKSLNAAESYKAAKTACEHAVRMIIGECIATNQKYTDIHFDLESDLKVTRRRDCIDGLTQDEDDRDDPSDVKRIADIFDDPKFFKEGAGYDDIVQGGLGDCWMMSAFSVLSCKQELLERVCVIRDEEVGVYGFVFFRDGEWFHTIIDDKLYLTSEAFDEGVNQVLWSWGKEQESKYNELFQRGSRSLYFAKCRDQNETWVPLLEKALAKAHGGYDALRGGQTGEAIEDLTGGVTTEVYSTNILSKEKFWVNELRKIGTEFMFDATDAMYREWQNWDEDNNWVANVRKERRQGVVKRHAYGVLDTYEGFGERLVKVRNPWGQSEWDGPWSDGSSQWTAEWLQRLDHKFGDDGVFWMSYKDFLSHFKHIDRTRIFDESWFTAQKWASMQVPFSTVEYQQTKFVIDVPEDTETVIVLSQLDERYFTGLEGKYSYTLSFRINMGDGEGDYLARSRPNYELRRSTNIELYLPKGQYTVLVKIEAEDWGRDNVEDVIKDNLPRRREKVTTLARLYDLAHQKGLPEAEDEVDPKTEIKDEASTSDEATQTPADGKTEAAPVVPTQPTSVTIPIPLPVIMLPPPSEASDDSDDEDDEKDPWNASCVVGLRVYSKQPELAVRVVWPPKPKPEEPIIGPMLDIDDITKPPQDNIEKSIEKGKEEEEKAEDAITEDKKEATEEKTDKKEGAKAKKGAKAKEILKKTAESAAASKNTKGKKEKAKQEVKEEEEEEDDDEDDDEEEDGDSDKDEDDDDDEEEEED